MKKLFAFLDLLRKGSAVSDPDLWKNRGAAVAAVAALIASIVQIARLYGYDIPLDADGILALAGGIVTLVCLFLAWGTSPNTGVPFVPPKPGPVDGKDPAAPPDERP